MRVTFLCHSGFCLELARQIWIFDWWKGELPPLPEEKAVVVFASHRHPDHFDPRIFALSKERPSVRYVLGRDIRLSEKTRTKWDVPAEEVYSLGGGQQLSFPELEIETLPSTDEGVAFVLHAEGQTVYFAGDLNWWHWAGESDAWNRNMEVNFKRYLEPLRGKHIDLAMAPLDARLGAAEDWGLRYLLETADVRKILPMHQWDDFSPTDRFLAAYPQWASQVCPVEHPGQQWEFT